MYESNIIDLEDFLDSNDKQKHQTQIAQYKNLYNKLNKSMKLIYDALTKPISLPLPVPSITQNIQNTNYIRIMLTKRLYLAYLYLITIDKVI